MDKYDRQAKGYLDLDEAIHFAQVLSEADPNSHFIPMINSVFEKRQFLCKMDLVRCMEQHENIAIDVPKFKNEETLFLLKHEMNIA